MPHVQEPLLNISLAMINQHLMIMHGIKRILKVNRILSAGRSQTHGDCTTFSGMSGNGYRTNGMITITTHPQMAVHGKAEMPPAGSAGAAAGTAQPRSAGLPFASSQARA